MSINAIGSVSLYEYYYQINREDERKKKSPLAEEMEKYGLVPTDSEALNISMLKKAKEVEKSQKEETNNAPSYESRPWADIMYQLGIDFNENPRDDIKDIKEELAKLMSGLNDEELSQEISDLEKHVENLYISFENNNSPSLYNDTNSLIDSQLNNLSMLNQINLI